MDLWNPISMEHRATIMEVLRGHLADGVTTGRTASVKHAVDTTPVEHKVLHRISTPFYLVEQLLTPRINELRYHSSPKTNK